MAEHKGNYRHGMYGTPTYKSWSEMKSRCKNAKTNCYAWVTYCKEWENFKNFFADMGERPNGTTLDRIDPRGNYEPSNCRWADWETQANNKRPKKRNVKWTIDGITKPARDWCDECGVSYESAMYRINHKGMSVREALTTPKITKGRNRKACNA